MDFDISKVSPDVRVLNPELQAIAKVGKPSKYGNAKTQVKGMLFDSGYEAAGVANLILLEQQYEIFALRLQVQFPLQAKISYIADAVYVDKYLKVHVVDFKGYATREYKIKRKLFKERYGQEIEEL